MRYAAMLTAIGLAVAVPAAAQNYAGSYSATNAAGVVVKLMLQQDSQGNLTGTLSNPQFSGQVQGTIEAGEGAAVGKAIFAQGMLFFYGELDGNQLVLNLIEPDANGSPNYDSAQELVFQREGAAVADGGGGGNPLSAFSGVQAQPGPQQMQQPQPGMMQSQMQRPGGTGQPGALDDGTPLGREWAGLLAGKKVTYMDTYSSGSSGGYSTKIEVHLCSNGQFLYRDQSHVSVDVPGAYGYSGGNQGDTGTWHIITQGNVAGIELRHNGGSVEQYRLDYQGGKTFANGTRVLVTPGEVCN